MTSWIPNSPATTSWASSTINNTDVQTNRIAEATAIVALLNAPMTSAQITELVYSLRLIDKMIIDGYSYDEIAVSAQEYWDYMFEIYTALGVEIAYWNAAILAKTVPANVIDTLQAYITVLTREQLFWFQDDPDWETSGEKGKEWQRDFLQAFYNSQANTILQGQKITTYTEEIAILNQKIDVMDALSALGFNLTYFTEESPASTSWTEV